MKSKYYLFFCGIYSSSLFAQDLPPDRTNFSDNNFFKQPNLLSGSSLEINVISPKTSKSDDKLEELINYAIFSKNWETLELLLDIYINTPGYDATLYQYGLGALYRSQKNYKKAIETYQNIVNANPDLVYPRFDLGMMFFEDKQYNAAENELKNIYQRMPENIKVLINQVIKAIKKSQRIVPQFNLDYKKTDNVNQASNTREVIIDNAIFIRNEDSLPQKAEGLSYQLGFSNSKNIFGNHYSYIGLNFNGTSYWDNADYSEQTLRASLGYQNKSYNQIIGVNPFIEQNILGGNRYGINYGLNFIYSKRINNKLQLSSNTGYIQKKYRNENLTNIYNGKTYNQSLFLNYQFLENFLTYYSIDFMNDKLESDSESSKRIGIRIGSLYSNSIISFDTNLRYSERKFDENNIWYNEKRIDDEYQFNLSIWKQQWQWNNFIPKLNYSYQKIDSNLPLYTRDNSNIFISINRDF